MQLLLLLIVLFPPGLLQTIPPSLPFSLSQCAAAAAPQVYRCTAAAAAAACDAAVGHYPHGNAQEEGNKDKGEVLGPDTSPSVAYWSSHRPATERASGSGWKMQAPKTRPDGARR